MTIFKGNETEALAATRLSVDHDRRVDDAPMLGEVSLQRLGSDRRSQSTDEQLLRSLMLKSGYSAFGVDLR